jgi:uncharacterized phage-associated protein
MDILKVIQAAAVLLRQHDDRMSRLRLLKLLYIAEREMIAKTLRPMTGDRISAMDHGPVLSQTYDLIKRNHLHSPQWDQYIAQRGPQDLSLIADPGVGRLSRLEIETLVQVSEHRRMMNDYDIAMETHDFAEWAKNKPLPGGSMTIPLEDLLDALKLSHFKQRIKDEAHADAELDQLLGAGGK